MLFLNAYDLNQCFDGDKLRVYMQDALISFSLKQSSNFPRAVFTLNNEYKNPMGFMPAMDFNPAVLGYKAITVFHQNSQHHLNPHQGIIVLLNEETGQVKCILDGSYITAVRTAAVSAVATDKLSRSDSSRLAIIGSGRQAIEHVLAISRVRDIQSIFVYTRSQESFSHFSQNIGNEYAITQALTPAQAVNHADIVVTCTSSKQSLLDINDVPEGVHINAIGACRPGDYEISLHDRAHLKVYLDSYESCLLESDEIKKPIEDNSLSKNTLIGELGSCLADHIPGRTQELDITVFKSIGLSIEDIYAAKYFYQTAIETNIGQHIRL